MNETILNQAANFIDSKNKYELGLVLGTGLGEVIEHVEILQSISYADIPGFETSTVDSHQGKLSLGKWFGKKVIIMEGRFHYYEGYDMKKVTFPIRVMKLLGVQKIIITNVSGGVNANYNAGDLVLVKDHINLHPENPLRGKNLDFMGPRFPDMLRAYDPELLSLGIKSMQKINIPTHQGVYVGLQGPNLETPAEYRFINIIGGDMVGMSSVPEVIVARHCNIKVLMVSMISNVCFPIEDIKPTTIEEVIAVANKAKPKMVELLDEIVKNI